MELGEQEIALATYHRLATTLWRYNEYDQAIFFANQGLELAQNEHDHKNEAIMLAGLGMMAFEKRDLSTARTNFEQSMLIAVAEGYLRIQANALNNLGMSL